MKSALISFIFICSALTGNLTAQSVKEINTEEFKKYIWNYEKEKEWKYAGKTPAIIDLYASWCGPCKRLAPILGEIQKELGNKIQIYKMDSEKEVEVSRIFNLRSIPLMVFIPKKGQPFLVNGLRPKEELMKIINENLGIKE